jgi:hypothetical protein
MCANRTSIGLKRIAAMIVFSVLTVSAASAQTPQQSGITVRQSDSLINGALIGAGAAVASGLVFCTLMEPWDNCRDDVGPMIRIGAIGAGIGMGIDALIRKKIYQSASGAAEVHAAPMLGRSAKGLRLSIKF